MLGKWRVKGAAALALVGSGVRLVNVRLDRRFPSCSPHPRGGGGRPWETAASWSGGGVSLAEGQGRGLAPEAPPAQSSSEVPPLLLLGCLGLSF